MDDYDGDGAAADDDYDDDDDDDDNDNYDDDDDDNDDDNEACSHKEARSCCRCHLSLGGKLAPIPMFPNLSL